MFTLAHNYRFDSGQCSDRFSSGHIEAAEAAPDTMCDVRPREVIFI